MRKINVSLRRSLFVVSSVLIVFAIGITAVFAAKDYTDPFGLMGEMRMVFGIQMAPAAVQPPPSGTKTPFNTASRQFTPGNLVINRIGDGSTTLSTSAAPVSLVELTTSGTAPAAGPNVISMPTAASANQGGFTDSGNSTVDGHLNLSGDGRYLLLTGIDAPVGNASVFQASNIRNIARVDTNGIVSLIATLSDTGSANPTAVSTPDAVSLYNTSSAGIRYVNASFGVPTTSTVIGSSAYRDTVIAKDSLGKSFLLAGTQNSIFGFSGFPTGSASAVTSLDGSFGELGAFFLLDRSPTLGASKLGGLDTLYVADNVSGLQKYEWNGSAWVARGSIAGGLFGLTARTVGSDVELYATSSIASNNKLLKFTDSSGFGGTLSGSSVLLASAGSKYAFRGVAFAPMISANPSTSQNFDSLGTSAAAGLPTDWRADTQSSKTVGQYGLAGSATTLLGGANMSPGAPGGIYNFGAGSGSTGSDRAIGFLTDAGVNQAGNLYLRVTNNTGSTIHGLTVGYNIEKYRNGTSPSSLQMYYSTTGSAPWFAAANYLTNFPADADNNGFTSAPGSSTSVVSAVIIPATSDGSDIYLAWNFGSSTGSPTSTGAAIGIDDVTIGVPTVALGQSSMSFGSQNVGTNSVAQSTSITATDMAFNVSCSPPSADFQISPDGINFYNFWTYSHTGSTVNGTLYVRFTPQSAGVKSGNVTCSSGGSNSATLAVSGTSVVPPPTSPASNIVFSNVTTTSMTLTWTNGDGSGRLVLARPGSVSASPTDGGSYTANSVFGSGTQVGSGNYDVYDGTGNSVTVTGLTPGTTYAFQVFEYNGSGASAVYNTAPVGGNPASQATPSIRYVATNGNDNSFTNTCLVQASPCATVTRAGNAAVDGDTISVAAGTYTESWDMRNKSSLSVIGAGADQTIFQAQPSPGAPATVLQNASFFNTNGMLVQGITFQNGGIPNGSPTTTGAGIKTTSSLTLDHVIVKNAVAPSGDGVAVYASVTTLTIKNSLVTGNTGYACAGIRADNSTLNLINTTVAGNTASDHGGGVCGYASNLNITKSTITGNQANNGGGLHVFVGTNTSLNNSIIAGNTGLSGRPDIYYEGPPNGTGGAAGSFTDGGYNILGKIDGANERATVWTAGAPNANHDYVGSIASPIDARLGSLSGSPIPTYPLLFGSLAIDNGSLVAGVTTDARGQVRPHDNPNYTNATGGDGSDIGAYEEQTDLASATFATVGGPLSFGTVAVGSQSAGTGFSVSGTGLSGVVVCTAPGTDFQVGDGTTFGPSYTLSPTSGTLASTTVYARFTPQSAGIKSGNVTCTAPGLAPGNVSVGGTGMSPAEPTTTSVSSSTGGTSTVGQNVTFTATVTDSSTVNSGTVTFYDSNTCSGTAIASAIAVNGSGQAVASTSGLTVGDHTITACYSGNSSFQASSGSLVQHVLSGTRYVATGGSDTANDCLTAGSPCATVAHAISQAAAGDTVSIAAGTYTQNDITVNKNLTIVGAGANTTTIQAAADPNVAANRVFTVNAGVTASISGLTVSNGVNASQGGNIENNGTLALYDCTVMGGSSHQGAGIENDSVMTIERCTVKDNISTGQGGGLQIFGPVGSTTITNSTFAGNTAVSGGAAIDHRQDPLTITNCTFTNNKGGNYGIFTNSSPAPTLTNSIVVDNGSTGDLDIQGTLDAASSYNIIGTQSGGLANGTNGNQTGVALAAVAFGPFGDHGGTTETYSLTPGSVAVDAGSAFSGLATDQRGSSRPHDNPNYTNAAGGDGSDVGAYEEQTDITLTPQTDLAIVKSRVSGSMAEQPAEYSIVVTNNGPTDALGATVTDNMPAWLTNVTWSCASTPPSSCGVPSGTGSINVQVDLLSGGAATFTVDGTVASSGSLANTASVAAPAGITDPVSGNDSATDTSAFSAPSITVSPATLPNGTVGVAYNNAITASGGVGPYTFSVTSGTTPSGLTLASDGTWSGTPTATGPFSFTVTATDGFSFTGSQAYSVTINPPPPAITVDTSSLFSFENTRVGGQSSEQSYTVSGTNLLGAITVTAPTDFQVSLTSGGPYSSSVTVPAPGGSITDQPIYVVFAPGSVGTKNETAANASTNATTQNVALSGTGYTDPLVVNDAGDAADFNQGDGVCETAAGNGICTLRAAIEEANALGVPTAIGINFAISGCPSGVCTITPAADLPAITTPLTIDGYTQSGSSANTLDLTGPAAASGDNAVINVVIQGSGSRTRGLDLEAGQGFTTVKGLAMQGFTEADIYINDNGGDVIQGNFIGTDASGTTGSTSGAGVVIAGGWGHSIGGDDPADRNLISGHIGGAGVDISTNDNSIEGNYIGTDRNGGLGAASLRNKFGILMHNGATGNFLGCEVPNGDNLISGNSDSGIKIDQGEFNFIEGNFIGTDRTVTSAVPNGNGVWIHDSGENFVGDEFGPGAVFGSVISGNTGFGILIDSSGNTPPSSSNTILGNLIGTDATGTAALGNGDAGISVNGALTTAIGGSGAGEGNIISANGAEGIEVLGATLTTIEGNFIGTNAAGNVAAGLGNASHGVELYVAAPVNTTDTIVGTSTRRFRPVEAGRHDRLPNDVAQARQRRHDAVGRQVKPLFATLNASDSNIIAGNGGDGVRVSSPGDVGNSIEGNSIFGNAGLGIELGSDGVTANDAGDVDDGPNHLQNYPVLGTIADGATSISGTLDSGGGAEKGEPDFIIDVYKNSTCDAPSGHGEGKTWIGSGTTSGGAFTITGLAALSTGDIITTTATDLNGNTSEFSACTQVATSMISVAKSAPSSVVVTNNFTYTITVSNSASATAAATGVVVTDPLPAEVSFVSGTPACSASGQTVTCTGSDIPVGGQEVFSVVVTANTVGTALNTATASATNDPNGTQSSAQTSTVINAQPPTLGTYSATTITLSGNGTVIPSVAPAHATSISVTTNSKFIGGLSADPVTGVVRITNAAAAGIYTVKVKAFGPGGTFVKTFGLSVSPLPGCAGTSSFNAAVSYAAGATPQAVAIGDFNGDGLQDAAVANSGSNNVSVLLGSGTGFAGAATFPVGAGPKAVAAGDVNGDGIQDLVTANQTANSISILLGVGNGTFGAASDIIVGSSPQALIISDFNGDGLPDIATANSGSNDLSIVLGTAPGAFGSATSLNVGTNPASIAVGDFNNDGFADLAAANNGSNNISVALGTGTGTFGSATNFNVGINPTSIAIGSFNSGNDANLDIVTANSGSSDVSVLLGAGDGTFGAATSFGAGSAPRSVAVGDLNGDGKLDLGVANSGSNNVSRLLGDGAGAFGAVTNFNAGTGTDSVAIGDFNGDGIQDIAASNETTGGLSVLIGTCSTDTAGPVMAITSTPTDPASSTSATFDFTATDSSTVVLIQCSLDGDLFTPCGSGNSGSKTYAGLTDGSHTFQVQGIDSLSQVSAAPASFTWVVDTTPPVVNVTGGPNGPTPNSAPTFMFTATDTGGTGVSSAVCKIDSGTFTDCISGTYTPGTLSSGPHTFTVQASDAAGNLGTDSRSFTVDTAPPVVTIIGGPDGPTSGATPTFTFTATDNGGTGVATVVCRIDSGAFTDCIGETYTATLSDGPHTFTVQAADAAGNVGTDSRSFTVDTAPPVVTITGGPNGPTSNSTPTFTFTVTDTGGTGASAVLCKIDSGTFTDCITGTYTATPGNGPHTFTVQATDAAGNVGTDSRSFTVDTAPPIVTITGGPNGPTPDATPTFSFTATDTSGTGVATVVCKIDGGSFTDCISGTYTSSALVDGGHTFTVQATDAAGNVGTDSRSFTVDTTAPVVTITGGPNGPTSNSTPTFVFTATDTGGTGIVTVTCKLDSGAFINCISGTFMSMPLSDGSHTFTVQGMDAAGNVGTDSRSFTVDTAPPVVTITGGPSGPTPGATPTFTFTATDTNGTGVAAVVCKIDSGAFTDCTSGTYTSAALTDGAHTFTVQATDAAGNVGTDSRSFTVDTVPPKVSSVTPDLAQPVPGNSDITINFSEPVNIAAGGITLVCGGNPQAFTPSLPQSGISQYVLHLTNSMPSGFNCTLTVDATKTADPATNPLDGDGNGTGGDNFVRNFTTSCSIDPVVQNVNDSGPGSLRQAVLDACVDSTITFAAPVTGQISISGEIVLTKNVTIQGSGAAALTVQNVAPASSTSRIFKVATGVSATVTDLTIANGNTTGAGADGGGIQNDGMLTVDGVTFTNNQANGGNGGGGIHNGGSLTVKHSTFTGNSSAFAGGGIGMVDGGTMIIADSTFNNNTSPQSAAFGMQSLGTPGTLLVVNSTISGNDSSPNFNEIELVANGGPLTTTLRNVTITGNLGSASSGSALVNFAAAGQSSTVTVGNSIIANNTPNPQLKTSGPGTATITSAGYNIISDASLTAATGDQLNTDPLLIALANNGGPTQTHALQPNSPAVDKGGPAGEIQLLASGGSSGTFTLTFNGPATAPLAFNTTAASIQAALNALPSIGGVGGSVTVTPVSSGFIITFDGTLADTNVPQITVANSGGAAFSNSTVLDGGQDQRGFTRPLDNPSVAPAAGGDNSDIGAYELQNVPPTNVSAGGPYTINEGDGLTLNGSAFDADNDSLTYTWDVNGDGTYGDAAGASPTLTWTQLNALGIIDGPSNVSNVTVQVDDGHGHVVTSAATTITVNNTAPTLALSGAASTVVGATYTLGLSSSDPGTDTITSWTITWGDGSPVQVVSGDPSSATHVYSSPATRTISATATDEDGTYAAGNTVTVAVNKADTTVSITSDDPDPSVVGQAYSVAVSVTVNSPGNASVTGTINVSDGSSACTITLPATSCSLTSTTAGTKTITATYSGDPNLNGSSSTTSHTVNKADTATVITNAAALAGAANATLVGQSYAVNFSVAAVAPGAGTPTGNVTVSDGTSSCVGTVAQGTCNLTSTTIGNKTITATYGGDANFNGSSASSVPPAGGHVVNLRFSGTVLQNGLPLQGASLALKQGGSTVAVTTTDAGGNYSFIGQFSGTYTIVPTVAGKTTDPLSRTFSNVLDNVSGANFNVFDSAAFPRTAGIGISYTVPGQAVTVPITINSLGNEAKLVFNIGFDPNVISGIPSVQCGTAAVNCSISVNTSTPGRLGITLVPQQPLTAGSGQIATVTFQTLPTALSNMPVTFENVPNAAGVFDSNNDPLGIVTQNGWIVFQQGIEGDVATRTTGDGQLLANDVTIVRNLVVATVQPDLTFNEFQRADTAPRGTLGDGQINASDVIQERRYVLGLDAPTSAGGPFTSNPGGPIAPPADVHDAGRAMKVASTNGVAGSKVSLDVTLDAAGDEAATSFTLNFDAMKLSNPTVTLGNGAPQDSTLTVGTADAKDGRVSILIDSMNSFEKAAGKQVVTVTFDVAPSAPTGDTEIGLTSGSISDNQARDLAASYTSGKISIGGPNSVGVSISGRILTPEGAGLRNAVVTLTDAAGNVRTVTSASLGYYTFDSVPTGAEYTITVTSKRYRFSSRKLTTRDNLADVNFTGME